MYVHLNVQLFISLATISFKIRTGTSYASAIYLIFSYGRKKELRYSTGYKVKDFENWNKEKQQVKVVLAEPHSKSINQSLRKLESFLENKYHELLTSHIEINNRVLRNELDIFLRRKKTKVGPATFKTLLECYKWYYEHFAKSPLPTTKKPLAEGTIKSYKTSNQILKEFNDQVYALSYEKITLDFYYDFLNFLKEKGFSNNYISNHIKMLKTIMNYAWEHKFHSNLDFKSKAFTKIAEDIKSIYLTVPELKNISALKLTGRMENARDLFIIAAYTGLRVSDLKRLSKEHIKREGDLNYIEIKTQKTGRTVVIPINQIVQKILDKRKGELPKQMPEQNMNNLLKKIGAAAGLNEIVKIEKTIGGNKSVIKKFKYEIITCHTARRAFCTNAYKAGMPTYDIMQISGHTSEKTFYRYIQISRLDILKKTAKHKFFN